MYEIIQFSVLAIALTASLWQFWGKVTPQARASVQQRLALALMSPQMPRGCNRLGMRLLPRVDSACGSGCSSCGICPSS